MSSPQHEPTMEEILASIRKIISEDSTEAPPPPAPAPMAPAPAMTAEVDVPQGGGDGMLATKVTMYQKGKPLQVEDYADWRVDIPLPDSLFDVRNWH